MQEKFILLMIPIIKLVIDTCILHSSCVHACGVNFIPLSGVCMMSANGIKVGKRMGGGGERGGSVKLCCI